MGSPGSALAGLVSPWRSVSRNSITPHVFTPHSEEPPCSSPTNHEAKHTEQPPAWSHTSGIHCSGHHLPILVIVQVPQVAAHFHVPLKKKHQKKPQDENERATGAQHPLLGGCSGRNPALAALTSCMARVRWSELIWSRSCGESGGVSGAHTTPGCPQPPTSPPPRPPGRTVDFLVSISFTITSISRSRSSW